MENLKSFLSFIFLFLLLPPPTEVGYVFTSVCLSVRLSVCLSPR